MLSATNLDGPAFNTRSRTAQHSSSNDTTPQTDAAELNVTDTPSNSPKSLTTDRLQALLQMQKTDPFCKCISKKTVKWKITKTQGQPLPTCKGTTLQTHHRFT